MGLFILCLFLNMERDLCLKKNTCADSCHKENIWKVNLCSHMIIRSGQMNYLRSIVSEELMPVPATFFPASGEDF